MTHINPTREQYDHVVIGAGIFGMYAALRAAQKGKRVLIVEKEPEPFMHASYANQARIHRGYHYPRSLSTALSTAHYVDRFVQEFEFAVRRTLTQIYAIAKDFSYTDALEYEKFCRHAGIPYEHVPVHEHFNPSMIEAAYRTEEYGFDAGAMKAYLLRALEETGSVTIRCGTTLTRTLRGEKHFTCVLQDHEGTEYHVETPHVINATYRGLNTIIERFGFAPFDIKYEHAELALCRVPEHLRDIGLTVMDGPFFSLMPFGNSGLHSLSAVSYTPHRVRRSLEEVTDARGSVTRFYEMRQLAAKYMRSAEGITYDSSLYTTKTILQKTELDDARPTLLHVHSEAPYFVSVMSGKLNTIFDLDAIV